jgi:hypothetical protein
MFFVCKDGLLTFFLNVSTLFLALSSIIRDYRCYRGSEGLGRFRGLRGLGGALNSQLLDEPKAPLNLLTEL